LQLNNYGKVISLLPFKERRLIAIYLVDNITQNNICIPTAEEVVMLLEYLTPLVKRPAEMEGFTDEDYNDDQTRVAYSINTFYNKDVEPMFEILIKAKEFFSEGARTTLNTMVPLVYKALQLVQTIHKLRTNDKSWEKKAKAVCKYANETVQSIKSTTTTPTTTVTCFHLYLQCALQTGKCGLSKFAYGFLTQGALTIYEEDAMAQSHYEFGAIRQLIGVVQSLECFDAESYEKLAKRIAQHSSKVAVLENQSRATLMSGHLFSSNLENGETFRDGKSSIACLKKSMTVGQSIPEPEVKGVLLVELLDYFIYFYNKHPDVVENKYINAIIGKVLKHASDSNISATHPSSIHFKNIQEFIEGRQQWENLVKKEKPKKEITPEGIEVEGDVGLSEGNAKKEAARWKEIQFTLEETKE